MSVVNTWPPREEVMKGIREIFPKDRELAKMFLGIYVSYYSPADPTVKPTPLPACLLEPRDQVMKGISDIIADPAGNKNFAAQMGAICFIYYTQQEA
jgi:hypothetical protein